jgi:hypothetical protein
MRRGVVQNVGDPPARLGLVKRVPSHDAPLAALSRFQEYDSLLGAAWLQDLPGLYLGNYSLDFGHHFTPTRHCAAQEHTHGGFRQRRVLRDVRRP